jgi:hypothetical protein
MKCSICGREDTECRIKYNNGKYLCPKHLTQWYRNHKFLEHTIYDKNDYIIREDYAEIVLRDKNCDIVAKAVIDLEDVDICKKYKWHLKKSDNNMYAIATINENKKIFLHRLVMDYTGNEDIDHIDRNGLNNRKNNLRICSRSSNIKNQSIKRKGIKKVESGRYQASITHNYKCIYIGTYDTFEEALQARLLKEKEFADN